MIYVVGNIYAELVALAAHDPVTGQRTTADDLEIYIGGGGALQALYASLSSWPVALVAQIGVDTHTEFILALFRKYGLIQDGIGQSWRPTGAVLCTVESGGRVSRIQSPGANATLAPDMVSTRLCEMMSGDILLCTTEPPAGAIHAALLLARQKSVTSILSLTPGTATLDPRWLECADWTILREPDYPSVAEAARSSGAQLAVHRGSGAARLVTADGTHQIVGTYPTGADNELAHHRWAARFAVALSKNRHPKKAARLARYDAAQAARLPHDP